MLGIEPGQPCARKAPLYYLLNPRNVFRNQRYDIAVEYLPFICDILGSIPGPAITES